MVLDPSSEDTVSVVKSVFRGGALFQIVYGVSSSGDSRCQILIVLGFMTWTAGSSELLSTGILIISVQSSMP